MAKRKTGKEILGNSKETPNQKLRRELDKERKEKESLLSQLEKLRAAKFKLSLGKPKTRRGGYCRLVVPDSHGCVIDKEAATAFLHDVDIINPSEVIFLGDHLECGGFLAEHHTLGYVAQTDYSFADDEAACNAFLDEIDKRCPNASKVYIEGNHERRIENWIVTNTRKRPKDAAYLRKRFSVDTSIHLSKRKYRWIRQGEFYDGVSVPATIKLGNCYFTHGSSTAKHAASVHVQKFGGNIVYGHTHRADSHLTKTVDKGSIGAWCPGCLCQLQPLWQHTNPTDWTHGYGLQLVDSSGDFLHVNVPIVSGKSLLSPLVDALK